MLTDKARAVYDFIVRYTDERGYPPTIREVGKEFAFSSTNGARYYLTLLERAGYVHKRVKGKSRAIVPIAKGGRRADALVAEHARGSESRGIPILGRVAAGMPLLAEENLDGHLSIEEMFPASDELFALRIQGLSMRDRGILDGDVVVVRRQDHAREGDAVVALVGEDATVKTYHHAGDAVDLVPENPDFKTLRVGPDDDFRVLGVVVGLVRPVKGRRV